MAEKTPEAILRRVALQKYADYRLAEREYDEAVARRETRPPTTKHDQAACDDCGKVLTQDDKHPYLCFDCEVSRFGN
jgi:MoxR-like ATPase